MTSRRTRSASTSSRSAVSTPRARSRRRRTRRFGAGERPYPRRSSSRSSAGRTSASSRRATRSRPSSPILLKTVTLLEARVIVIATSPDVTPSKLWRDRLAKLVERLPRDASSVVWEPSGLWETEDAAEHARKLEHHGGGRPGARPDARGAGRLRSPPRRPAARARSPRPRSRRSRTRSANAATPTSSSRRREPSRKGRPCVRSFARRRPASVAASVGSSGRRALRSPSATTNRKSR